MFTDDTQLENVYWWHAEINRHQREMEETAWDKIKFDAEMLPGSSMFSIHLVVIGFYGKNHSWKKKQVKFSFSTSRIQRSIVLTSTK